MDDALMAAYEVEEKSPGFPGMLKLLLFRPYTFFKKTVARDEFPYLTFSAWLLGLAMALQLMDRTLLTPGGLVSGRISSFILLMLMSLVFMGLFYLIGGILFHFYAYLADSRKDMKNSVAVTIYAWMPFVLAVFLAKIGLIIAFGSDYHTAPSEIPILNTVIYAILGISILYGWFLAVFGAVVSLGCRKLRAILMLFVVPILWFVFLYMLFQYFGYI
ncbi:MAG: hypothetical protein GWO41_11895 [candidate division Zixibacteria bacterium]|nr:hypothetical protein [candidate division Zixibacteria bacterium]NIS17033.1 hypothetical protein [candidate division Zixibacteria bacterium]NIS45284.1 hypothetical protein [candidate division Zixibacteria bacterium]NIT53411.1 hypothetical protein [candidate division Zixibacteria bacterium]NIW41691.1 hypothetical protein [candidate division Zixibacteria bacterium]